MVDCANLNTEYTHTHTKLKKKILMKCSTKNSKRLKGLWVNGTSKTIQDINKKFNKVGKHQTQLLEINSDKKVCS